jgi:hypothetical protein
MTIIPHRHARATMGDYLFLGSCSNITEVAHIFVVIFFQSIDFVLMLTKMDRATFWAIFSQTHLVTLTQTLTARTASTPIRKKTSINGL